MEPFLNVPIAHRTLHNITAGVPENSWEGLDAAISKGVPVEIDIQLSKDGVPMVFHDYRLDRLTLESGRVSDFNASELTKMPLLYGGKTIPRFDEFMGFVAGRIAVLVEMKDQSESLSSEDSGLEAAVCEILRIYTGPSAVMSFNPHMIYRCKEYAPDIPRGLVTEIFNAMDWAEVDESRRDELTEIPDYTDTGSCFVSHNRGDLQTDPVARIKQQGGAVFCWTVRSKEQEDEALRVADNITFEGYLPDSIA